MEEGEGPNTDAEPEEGSSLHVQGAAMCAGRVVRESDADGGGGEVGFQICWTLKVFETNTVAAAAWRDVTR